jgi:hypothetical protein
MRVGFFLELADRFSYTCCEGGCAFGACVQWNVQRMRIQGDGFGAVFLPTAPTSFDNGSAECPAGPINYFRSRAGGCDEAYTVSGNFIDANTVEVTMTMTFTGSECDCFGGFFGTPCANQSFAFTARR